MQTTQLETSRVTGVQEPPNALGTQPPAVPPLPPTPEQANAPAALAAPLTYEQIVALKETIVSAIHGIFDPEIPVNIYELGLIYDIEIAPEGAVKVRMTLTSPACPAAGALPGEVERKIRPLPNVTAVKVDVVFDPPWTKDRMSEAAKLQLGIDD